MMQFYVNVEQTYVSKRQSTNFAAVHWFTSTLGRRGMNRAQEMTETYHQKLRWLLCRSLCSALYS